jgi:hypothetical protein
MRKEITLKNWVKWVSVAVTVLVGIYFTGNPLCLWAFFIPVFSDIVS